MSRGRPALGCAARRMCVIDAMRSIVSSIGAGPTLQFTPMTSGPCCSRAGANCSGGVPSRLLPSSSVVICATIGRPQMLRTAAIAALTSLRSRNVSRMNRSTPPSSSACACSRKYASASSLPVLPHGSMRMPSGPIAPATYAWLRAALFARRAPSTLISRSRSARPKPRSLMRLAPKVFVSMTSAPGANVVLVHLGDAVGVGQVQRVEAAVDEDRPSRRASSPWPRRRRGPAHRWLGGRAS